WACANLMKFNKAKCKVPHLCQANPKDKYRLGGEWIENHPEKKDLGVLVGKKLNTSQQCVLAAQKASHRLDFIKRGMTRRLSEGWKHSPTVCHGLIQAALEKGKAPDHLQYINNIIVWENTPGELFEKEKIIQILLKASFAIKRSKVKRPAQEIQFLGVKWQDGHPQILTEIIKITAMSPPTKKKETQAFLGAIGFWRMHIPEYSQIVSPLYLVTRKKNDFHWGPEQQQAFVQIKQEIAHTVALGPVRMRPNVKNVLYSAARNNSLSWSLWQKVPGETRGRPLRFWSRSYRGSEANYTPTKKRL
ncbi:hypothetical protein HGM15179_020264, partial [Zosterops borbonicus]